MAIAMIAMISMISLQYYIREIWVCWNLKNFRLARVINELPGFQIGEGHQWTRTKKSPASLYDDLPYATVCPIRHTYQQAVPSPCWNLKLKFAKLPFAQIKENCQRGSRIRFIEHIWTFAWTYEQEYIRMNIRMNIGTYVFVWTFVWTYEHIPVCWWSGISDKN
jgi:hypothetical protein